jgi:hypothetical protein
MNGKRRNDFDFHLLMTNVTAPSLAYTTAEARRRIARGRKPFSWGLVEEGRRAVARGNVSLTTFARRNTAMVENKRMNRRTALQLMAATGAFALTRGLGLGPRRALAQRRGSDELIAGWNLDRIDRLDPAIIAGTEIMQIASNIYSGLIYADHDLIPRGDLAESWEASSSFTMVKTLPPTM